MIFRGFSHRTFTLINRTAVLLLSLFLSVVSLNAQTEAPRGFHPGKSYALSDIESISMSSGNMSLNIPLASLPAGRGSAPGSTLTLLYNSKLFDSYPEIYSDPLNPGLPYNYTHNLLQASDKGGWRYGAFYQLQLTDRRDYEPFVECNENVSDFQKNSYVFKLSVTFPDGSSHEFRPYGYNDYFNDGYYNIRPDGLQLNYACQCQFGTCSTSFNSNQITTGMTYYSTDGTYLRLVVGYDTDGYWGNNPWTLYFPDGGRVTGGNAPQRTYDRNGNYTEVSGITYNGNPALQVKDQLNRSIIIEYQNSPVWQDFIYEQGFNNEQLKYTVKWKTLWVYRNFIATYEGYPTPPGNNRELYTSLAVVDQVILPDQTAPGGTPLSYSFTYSGSFTQPTSGNYTQGWGELKSVTMPSGAQAQYRYYLESQPSLTYWDIVLDNYPDKKDLTYLREYDGSSSSTTETWYYGRATNLYGYVTAPDGGVTKDYFTGWAPPAWNSNLAIKSEKPDGTVIERIWQRNIAYNSKADNPYVKTEFVSIPDSVGNLTKTSIKDYNYDKNGNVTQVVEYDWVAYSSIPRDAYGRPTGSIPGGATIRRVTVNTYYNPTPDASDTTTDDADVYHKTTSPNIKRAIESSEVRSGLSTSDVLSRTESFYDNASTTGNLTEQKSWDSTKGAISRPLGSGNSISVSHTYDSYGNRTLTTDARGYQTQFTYGSINGYTGLYVTQTKTAYGTTVQRTTNSDYDFQTGLVTTSTDADNNVTTVTTYDVFGRPTLVEEANGTSVERQTATEYSDTLRRVITRKDKDATADQKLVMIEHYDQLGRLRLSRELEDAATQSATNETHGVKVQHRYAYSGSNSYTLVSAPYRASYSSGAGSEPGMAWKRTKFDNGGRVLELETFVGASLPAPWGSSTSSSGKVTTSYDANTTTVTDQANKKRRSVMDGLGRLVRVDEPDSSNNLGTIDTPIQPTYYTYNALGNLIQTSQAGVPVGGSTSITQTRTFNYSSLGRLTSSTNPESGTVSFQYDNNGNLTQKTDARNVVTTYTYDQLNRNTSVQYSDGTPTLNRYYDGATLGKGRFWYDTILNSSGSHRSVDSYDALGRPLVQRQHLVTPTLLPNGVVWLGYNWSPAFTVTRTYNLAGAVTSQTYPSSRTVNYTYDAAGDLEKFTGNLGTGTTRTYADYIDYNAQGQMLYEQFGTDTVLHHNLHYNARGQLYDVRLGTQNGSRSTAVVNWGNGTWDRGAIRTFFNSDLSDYGTPTWTNNNGNVWRQDHFAPITTDVSQWAMAIAYYGYDTNNRVTGIWENKAGHATSETSVYTQQYLYDRFGNRLVNNGVSNVPNVPNQPLSIDGNTNRLTVPSGYSGTIAYDNAGNQTSDNWTMGVLGGGSRTYDAENRMTSAVSGAGTSSYVYDADGRRVRRTAANGSGSQTFWQIYGLDGELIAEYEIVSGTPTLRKEYGYRNGQLLVVAESNKVQWLVTDALGTPRMVVDHTGSLSGMKRHDYLPFGEEVLAGVGLRTTGMGYTSSAGTQSIRQQFTGKERDVETGLDYFLARYYSANQGRFTSPDEFTGGPDELYDFAEAASDNPTFYADLLEPQSLNKYQYCYNNPLIHTDPDGHKPKWLNWDNVQTGISVLGFVPVIGDAADLVNAGISVARGNYQDAALNAVGAIPVVGSFISGGVKGVKAIKAVSKLENVAEAASKAKTVNRAAGPCGLCFTAGTKVSTPNGLVNIENLRVGDRITATGVNKNHPDGWTAVDPKNWRVIKLLMPDPKGSEDVYEIELLRSLEWIRKVGAAPRRFIDIELTEMGLVGKAQVAEILPCPQIKAGPGRVVLMTVTHMDQGVLEISFAGMEKPLEPTASHPLYSEDRKDWIPAGQLLVGEWIRTRSGKAQIETIKWKGGQHRVYNLEVEADHSYFVSRLELLSHNSNPCAAASLPPVKGMPHKKIEKTLANAGFQRTKVSNSVAKNQEWTHADKSKVLIHPYGDVKTGIHKTGNNAHVHKYDSQGNKLNDRGRRSNNPNETHIGISNPRNLPQVRGRNHGEGTQ